MRHNDLIGWHKEIDKIINIKMNIRNDYIQWIKSISEKTHNKYSWEKVVDEIR